MRTYLITTMAIGFWANRRDGLRMAAAGAVVAPLILPLAVAHELRCQLEEGTALRRVLHLGQ